MFIHSVPHPLIADKGQILLSEKLPVPPISLFLISNIKLVYKKCPEYKKISIFSFLTFFPKKSTMIVYKLGVFWKIQGVLSRQFMKPTKKALHAVVCSYLSLLKLSVWKAHKNLRTFSTCFIFRPCTIGWWVSI